MSTHYKKIPTELVCDVLVIGAGMAGICAAVSAARQGAEVILLEKYRALGGNGSSEVGVHPSGAHRFHPYAAETGVIEEIIEEAAWRRAKSLTYGHHYNISPMWDTVLSDTLDEAGVLTLRCHYARKPVVENGRITKVIVEDIGTYKTREISVRVAVIDSSGDGHISAEAGARFRMGRESKDTYGERLAPEVADDITMGSSLVGYARKSAKKVEFIAPPGTPEFSPGYAEGPERYPLDIESAFLYPCETGGESGSDTIEDEHEIYRTVLKQFYAWWEKTVTDNPENEKMELVWISPRVAKRESRRFVGAYTINANDTESGRIFEDEIGFGGFAEDIHYPRPENEKCVKIRYMAVPPLYSIPYRSIYSADIKNLFFASRLASASHIAHGTVRLQRTLTTLGMAAGTAAALCKKYDCTPADIYDVHMKELQQLLLKNDVSLLGCRNEDDTDLARKAKVTADSYVAYGVGLEEEQLCLGAGKNGEAVPAPVGEADVKQMEFLTLDRVRGVMLWDWADRLDSFQCYVKNETDEEKQLKLNLKLFTREKTYKSHGEQIRFPYRERSNEMEWGSDDTAAKFALIREYMACVPAEFEGWITVPMGEQLIAKNPYWDEERYLVEIESCDGVSWACSRREYDFCRRAELAADADTNAAVDINRIYNTFPEAHVYNITPAPKYGEPENVIDGISRRWATNPVHMWMAKEKSPQSLELSWEEPVQIREMSITFDSLERAYAQMPFDAVKKVSEKLVKHFTVEALVDGTWQQVYEKDNNYHRFNRFRCNAGERKEEIGVHIDSICTERIRINCLETWGDIPPRIYEVRAYS